MRRSLYKTVFVILVIVFIGIQYIELDRTNPPVKADLEAPREIKNLLKKACYDCHSYETTWPWYSKVAPVSWLVSDDVEEARKHLNFSEWENLPRSKKEDLKKNIWEELVADDMPPKKYIYLHPDASLEMIQKNILKRWLQNND